ncbi:MAG: hypothetical protein KDC95_22615, partial [Planctomycetes bacterium]|nr:hypothetical protein [Planctomycetota bacterium]
MNTTTLTIALTTLCVAFAVTPLEAQRGGRRRAQPNTEQEKKADAPKPDATKPAEKKKDEAKKPEPVTAYVGGTVHVGDGSTLRRATVLVTGSKVTAVGRDVEIPKEATRIDCTGKHVSPGFTMFDVTGIGAPYSVGKDDTY